MKGWICPRCDACLAPYVRRCDCRDRGDAVPLRPISPTLSGSTYTSTTNTDTRFADIVLGSMSQHVDLSAGNDFIWFAKDGRLIKYTAERAS